VIPTELTRNSDFTGAARILKNAREVLEVAQSRLDTQGQIP
jgi:hypothetical protein